MMLILKITLWIFLNESCFFSCLQCANFYDHGQLHPWGPILLTEIIIAIYLKSNRTVFAISFLLCTWVNILTLCCSNSGNLIHLFMFCWGCELFWQQYIIYFIQWFSIFTPAALCRAPYHRFHANIQSMP